MKKFCITLMLSACLLYIPAFAEDNSIQTPDVSIGINGNYGKFNFKKSDSMNINNEPGMYTGGGLTVEKMISDNFGFSSGIQYRYFHTDFSMGDESSDFIIKWIIQTVDVPVLMIFSFRGEWASLNFTAGAVYSYIFSSMMKTDSSNPTGKNKDDALKFTDANQIGLTAGASLRFKVTQYTDLVLGVTGEYYPTNLLYLRDDSDDKLNLYNYSLTAGYMFRTNIFSGSDKKN